MESIPDGPYAQYRVNGGLLPKFSGRPVTLLGSVEKIAPDGKQWELKTSDGNIVLVSMQSPLDEHIRGIVEIRGVAQGRNTVLCKSYVMFSDEMVKDFDMQMYNETVNLINTVPNPFRNLD